MAETQEPRQIARTKSSTERQYESQIDEWKKRRDTVEPTPEIGEDIWYYRGGIVNEQNVQAAKCTAIEQPGRIQCVLFAPQAQIQHKQAVRFAGTCRDVDKRTKTVHDNGLWAFKGSQDILSRHKAPWKDYCTKRIDSIKELIEKLREQEDYVSSIKNQSQ